ncbi:MAG: ABC transporter substrate-binding protein [Pseudomonadota bacterium]
MRTAITGLAAAVALTLLAEPAPAKTLKWAYEGDVNSMDPYALRESFTANFQLHIYEGLVRHNKDLKIEPSLATSWQILEPTVWHFKLRQGVKFHNGNPFDADDVVASFKRAGAEGSPYRGSISTVKDVRKVDRYTVEFHLTGPYPLLLNDLTGIYIMDYEWMVANNTLQPVDPTKGQDSYASTHANGTGPFILKSRQPDARTILVVNPNWWDKVEHNLTEIVFTPIKSDATRVAALLSGEIDVMMPAPLQDIQRIDRVPGLKVLQGPELRTLLFGLDQKSDELRDSNIKGKNPLKDVRVRQALYQAIDIEAVRTRVMRGSSRNTALLVAPEVPGFDAALNARYPHDPAAARRLLAEAGYPNGFEVGVDCPNDRYVNDEEICQAVVAMWARVGMKPKLTVQTKGQHFSKMLGGKSDIYLFGWATLPMFDSYSVLANILHTPDGTHGQWNPGGYANKRVDELTKLIARELDEKKRLVMISEAFKIHKEEFGTIPLHQQALAWAVRDNVTVIQHADNYFRMWYVTIK